MTFPVSRAKAGLLLLATLAAVPALSAQGNKNDPRVGLKAGLDDAGTASKGMTLISHSPKADSLGLGIPPGGLTFANSDLAFKGNTVIQGNFSGFIVWDVSNPMRPVIKSRTVCPTDQGDPSVYGNLLFVSDETTRGRTDCGSTPFDRIADTVSKLRARGVRIFDISDISKPKLITTVQTCRGSHTHTIVDDPKDKSVIYIYVSGSSSVRSPNELAGCSNKSPVDDPNSSRYRIDVIRVPLAHPEQSKVVSSPKLFDSLTRATAHGVALEDTLGSAGRARAQRASGGRGGLPTGVTPLPAGSSLADTLKFIAVLDSIQPQNGRGNGGRRGGPPAGAAGAPAGPPAIPRGPEQCHDITVYPSIGLGAGACGQYGLLLDLSDPANPKRLQAVSDTNFSFWHSATFSNDGSKLLFTDEWGGGTGPKCRATDPITWGGDALFSLKDKHLTPGAYYKIPQVQTSQENCVAHNGGLIPVPGRDILVQAWYQGGVSAYDFSDVNAPKEIAYFDRGPISDTALVTGGYWGAYYYNGHIYASEIARGLDVFDLVAGPDLSQNEIDAAKLVTFAQLNPQDQPKLVWPAAFPVVRSYLDQLVRSSALPADRTTKIAADITAAEKLTGAKRSAALTALASALDKDVFSSKDAARVRWMASAVRDLAKK